MELEDAGIVSVKFGHPVARAASLLVPEKHTVIAMAETEVSLDSGRTVTAAGDVLGAVLLCEVFAPDKLPIRGRRAAQDAGGAQGRDPVAVRRR